MKKWIYSLAVLCLVMAGAVGVVSWRNIGVPAYQETFESILESESESEAESKSESEAESKSESEVETEVAEGTLKPEQGREETEAATESEIVAEETEDALESEAESEGTEDSSVPDSETEVIENSSEIPSDIYIDTVSIDLPGVEKQYDLLFISDMHILTVDETVTEEHIPTAGNRYENMFRSPSGDYSPDMWKKISAVIDTLQADAVVFGGDMMDFVSPNNVALLKEGLVQVQTPYMYLRADHDLGTWYSGFQITAEDALTLHAEICDYSDMYVMDLGEFYVLGWNNSTSQLTEAGLLTATEIWDDGKPIILATHVPIISVTDSSLAEAAASADPQGRVKLWGDECLYQPNENTSIFLNMLYEPQSPVKVVLSGHLHFKHTAPLTDQTYEYVFAPAFAGNIAHIRIY